MWLLNLLSKIGVHSVPLLHRKLMKACQDLNKIQFNIYHHPEILGYVYIEAGGKGPLQGLVIFVDFRQNGSFDHPTYKVEQFPYRCRKTYLYAQDNMGNNELMQKLVHVIVYGILPLIVEACKDHIVKEFEDLMDQQ